MVYCISSLRKIRFNRNILYCKFFNEYGTSRGIPHLIGTFCIVNVVQKIAIISMNMI